MTEVHNKRVTILNEDGLHLRPADSFVNSAKQFGSEIFLIKDDVRVDGKSILSILTLGAEQGTELSLEATGPDADDALAELARLFEQGFPAHNNGKES